MESSEFIKYLSHFPALLKLLDGIYSIDTIPRNIKVKHFIFCNTDVKAGAGIHWFCLYRVKKDLIECFDSLGFSDQSKKEKLLQSCNFRNIESIKINTSSIQLSSTDTCGRFCLMFIIERLHNLDLTFDELLNSIFTDDCAANEVLLDQFFKDMFE